MSGPVWRFERQITAACDVCLREHTGVFIEGEVRDSSLSQHRHVCTDCLQQRGALVVGGELGRRVAAPAYARRSFELSE